ncbi:MAG: 50S ribosomal protein L31 [Bacteroidaceae bacterium]|nr:50S ribosomal protein L31 [Bacteroidaceae bacterium]
MIRITFTDNRSQTGSSKLHVLQRETIHLQLCTRCHPCYTTSNRKAIINGFIRKFLIFITHCEIIHNKFVFATWIIIAQIADNSTNPTWPCPRGFIQC